MGNLNYRWYLIQKKENSLLIEIIEFFELLIRTEFGVFTQIGLRYTPNVRCQAAFSLQVSPWMIFAPLRPVTTNAFPSITLIFP